MKGSELLSAIFRTILISIILKVIFIQEEILLLQFRMKGDDLSARSWSAFSFRFYPIFFAVKSGFSCLSSL